jgi:hypothetical protein
VWEGGRSPTPPSPSFPTYQLVSVVGLSPLRTVRNWGIRLFLPCTTLRAGPGAELSGIDPAGGAQVSKLRLHQLPEITYSEGNFRWSAPKAA